jgi:DNA modification methylase
MKGMEAGSVQCCITSPPYWGLRDYGCDGQIGLESAPEEYVQKMVEVFREVKRVLKDDGTLWMNLGDSYVGSSQGGGDQSTRCGGGKNRLREQQESQKHVKIYAKNGLKTKDIVGIPWRVALALQADGWYLRQDIIWHKPNPMPESVTDRCTKAHEYLFLLAKSERYYFDNEAIQEKATGSQKPRLYGAKSQVGTLRKDVGNVYKGNGKANKRSVWTVNTQGYSEAHFATFPPKLIEPCVLAGCPEGGTILDPFNGAGTTGLVATRFGRNYIGIELNQEYIAMSEKRIANDQPLFNMEAK